MADITPPRGALLLPTVFSPFPSTNRYGLSDVGNNASPRLVDIDGDGDLDALIGNADGNIFADLNTGTASSPAFGTRTLNPYGLGDGGSSANPSFVDIDADGDLDALIGSYSGNTLLYLNTGTASSPAFAAAIANPHGLGDVGQKAMPSLADIDGDGDLDAMIGNLDGDVWVYLNTGTASSPAFAAATVNPYGLANSGAHANPVFVDLDGDGDLDALMGNGIGNTLAYLNTGTAGSPAFAAAATNPYGLGDVGYNASPSFADIDNDGDLDAFIGHYIGNTEVFTNNTAIVAPVTTTTASGSYGTGSVITLQIAFNENVIVAGGVPRLRLETGAIDRFATYDSGSGTQILTFTYTVQAGDSSARLDVASANALLLNGSTIRDAAGNNAILTLAIPGTTGSLGANAALVIDAVAPQGSLHFSPVFAAPVTNPFGLVDVGFLAKPVLVDIDSDGDLDAFFTDGFGDTRFCLNTGTASSPAFAAPVTNPYGLVRLTLPAPGFVDIDGDGDLDAMFGSNTSMVLFLNTGSVSSPAFAAAVTNPFGLSSPGSFSNASFADIDGDGDLDAIVGTATGSMVAFLNTGNANLPAFAAPVFNPYGLSDVGSMASPRLVDLDGDGDLDALVGNDDGNTLVFLNTGSANSPAFAAATTNPYGLADIGQQANASYVDIDGDGDLDALIGERYGNTLFFINTAPPVLAPVTTTAANGSYGVGNTITLQVSFSENVFVAGGIPTLALETGAIDRFATYASGSGSSVLNFTYTVQAGDSTALLDLKGTGALALNGGTIQDAAGNNAILTLASPGAAGSLAASAALAIDGVAPRGALFTPVFASPLTNPYGLSNVAGLISPDFADIDGDGDLDAVVGNSNGDLLVFVNTGSAASPAFAAAVTNPYGLATSASNFARPSFVDIDRDGDLDAFVGSYNGNIQLFLNTGSAGSPAFAAAVVNPYGLSDVDIYASPTFADIDGDGDLDAFVGDYDGKVWGAVNTGSASSPAFAAAVANPYGLSDVGFSANPSFADIDGDGDLDALVGNGHGNTLVFLNTGSSGSPAFAAPTANPYGLSDVGIAADTTLADMDGDGDLDILVGNGAGNTLVFINNSTAVAPVASSSPNATYVAGTTITLQIAFNENVIVDTSGGIPTLALETGTIDGFASYSGGTGTKILIFTYTVQATDTAADLDYLGSAALTLNGGTIRDAAGNDADLSLAAPGSNGSLAFGADLVITGTVNSTGSASNDIMRGGSANDSLDGAGGHDRLAGRSGNDQLLGGEGNDSLFGQGGEDDLVGGNGRDLLDGGSGADTMEGGDGNDAYCVDDAGDVVTEAASSGIDSVYSYISSYTLNDNIERGVIRTSAAASLTGNELNNSLYGSTGNDSLDGAAGDDTLSGGAGADQITGGAGRDVMKGGQGADTFVFHGASGRDTIKDFSHADGDRISLQSNLNGSGITEAANALAHVSDKWGSAVLDLGDGNVIKFIGLMTADLTAADFLVF